MTDKIERAREALEQIYRGQPKDMFYDHIRASLDEATVLRAERDQLRRLLSDWREQYGDGYGPDGDLIDETDALLVQEDKRECGFIYIKRERDQLREALEDTQRLLGRYLYLAGDIATNSASYRYEANRILLAQEDKDDGN